MICNWSCTKSIMEQMLLIAEPQRNTVCKNYLDDLKKIAKDLDLEHIYPHADEDVCSKFAHINWKHGDFYKKTDCHYG